MSYNKNSSLDKNTFDSDNNEIIDKSETLTDGTLSYTPSDIKAIEDSLLDSEYTNKIDNILLTNEPTGFLSKTDSELLFNNTTRTFSIQPTGAYFIVLEKGIKYIIDNPLSITIPNVEGLHHIYISEGVFYTTQTITLDIIKDRVFVASIYWDTTNAQALTIGDERHGCRMDGTTHAYLHATVGSAFVSGGVLGNFVTDANGTLNSHAQFSIGSGVFYDEDINFELNSVLSTNSIDVFYRSGTGNWRREVNTGFKVLTAGTGRLAYNLNTGGSWSKAEVINNYFSLYHIFMSNDYNNKYVSLMGQNQYSSLTLARQGAVDELTSLVMEGLPFKEFVAIGTVIFETRNSYINAVKSRVRTTTEGFAYVDWRYNDITPSGFTTNNHNDLSGRDTANSHTSNAISYDNTVSGLTATNVKSAIDELDNKIDSKIYTMDFITTNWQVSGSEYSITISSGTHGQTSKYLEISTYETDGSGNHKRVFVDYSILSNLNVVLKSSVQFNGYVVIRGF